MTIKINGKPFDFDSKELYEAERPKQETPFYLKALSLLVLAFVSWALYPWVVLAIKTAFIPLMNYFGIPY